MKFQVSRHRTHIVVTLGPSIETPARIRTLVRLGVDLFRANVSHGSAKEHARRFRTVRRIARQLRKKIRLLVDLPGPKFRLGVLPKGTLLLKSGQAGWLLKEGVARRQGLWLPLRHCDLMQRLKVGHSLFLNDGTVEIRILSAAKGSARFRVIAGGTVRSGSGVNLPQTDLGITLPVQADLYWIRFAAEHKAEWLAVSFVQTAEDIRRVREEARRIKYVPRIMAKIEKRKALENLEAIVRVSDGVMVARGDLGVETPLEEIAFAQKRIIAAANRQKKFVVTATQMLESMVNLATPTRAEVTDIANAVIDGTNGVMLSAETAIGRYPVEAVSVLARVLRATERSHPPSRVISKD